MRIIKLAVISFVVLFVLATAISLLLPSSITISRAIDIYSSKDTVYGQINNLEQWKYWIANRDTLPVSVNDSGQKVFNLGTTKAWIISSTKKQILTNWQFVQKVKWYPWEKLASIVSDKILGQFMEASLDNLKRHVEQQETKD
jgi:hypothetical protein